MKRRLVAITVCMLLAHAVPATAGIDKAGTTAANFLTVGQGASVLGMGGATLGFGADLNTAYWNSASLTRLGQTQVVFSHASLDQENNQEWAAVGGRWGQSNRFWSATGLYQGNGSFDGRDALGNPTGTFSASSMALGFNVAQSFSSNVSLGLGAQYVTESLGDMSGSGFTFNAGVQVQRGIWGLGAAAQNVFGKMNYSGVPYPFPGNYGLGVSVSDPTRGLRFALDLNFPDAYYSDVRTGVEWRYKDNLALRTGYRKELGAESGEPLGGPTFGMGAGTNGFWFDYGLLTGGGGAAAEHRIGLTYRPGLNVTMPGHASDTPSKPATETAAASSTTAGKQTKPPADQTLAAEPVMDQAPPRPASTTAKTAPATTTKAAPTMGPEVKPGVQYVAPAGAALAVGATASDKSAPATTTTPSGAKPTTAAATTTTTAKSTVQTKAPVATGTPSAAGAAAVTTTAAVATKELAAPSNAKELATPSNTKSTATPTDDSRKLDELTAVSAPAATEAAKPAAGAVTTSPAPAAVTPAAAAPAPVAQGEKETPKPAAPAAVAATPAPEPAKPAQQVTKPPAEVATPAPAKPVGPRPGKVKVQKGESMADIAQRWGTSSAAIMMENNLVTDKVKSGQELKLPPAGRK